MNILNFFSISIGFYVVMLFVAFAFESLLVKNASSVFIILITAALFIRVLCAGFLYLPNKNRLYLYMVFYLGSFGSLLVNYSNIDFVEYIKFLLFPLFCFVGAAAFHENLYDKKLAHYSLIVMIIFPAVALFFERGAELSSYMDKGSAGIFSNKNNAGLYVVCLIGLYGIISDKIIKSKYIYLGVAVFFQTVGLFFAVLFSLMIVAGRVRQLLWLMAIVAFLLYASFFFEISWISTRFSPIVNTYTVIFTDSIDVTRVSYGELVELIGSNDLSLVFRIKHWSDIFSIIESGGVLNIFFGYGFGASVRLTEMGLVPHNDYLRILFEIGLIGLIGFLLIILQIIKSLNYGWYSMPVIVIAIYLSSENLVNNFLAMMILFFYVGFSEQKLNKLNA